MDEQMEDDRQWFESHPSELQRLRPPFDVEISEFEAVGLHNIKTVQVVQIEPGVRARTPLLNDDGYDLDFHVLKAPSAHSSSSDSSRLSKAKEKRQRRAAKRLNQG